MDNVSPTRRQQARAAAIAAEIAALGFALPGTLTDRPMRCGHPRCRCHADPPQLHGPYHQWTRKKNGRTSTRILTEDQLNAALRLIWSQSSGHVDLIVVGGQEKRSINTFMSSIRRAATRDDTFRDSV